MSDKEELVNSYFYYIFSGTQEQLKTMKQKIKDLVNSDNEFYCEIIKFIIDEKDTKHGYIAFGNTREFQTAVNPKFDFENAALRIAFDFPELEFSGKSYIKGENNFKLYYSYQQSKKVFVDYENIDNKKIEDSLIDDFASMYYTLNHDNNGKWFDIGVISVPNEVDPFAFTDVGQEVIIKKEMNNLVVNNSSAQMLGYISAKNIKSFLKLIDMEVISIKSSIINDVIPQNKRNEDNRNNFITLRINIEYKNKEYERRLLRKNFITFKNNEVTPVIKTTWYGLNYIVDNNEITIKGYKNQLREIIIPEEIEGYPVTRIGSNAFFENEKIETVILSPYIKSIDNNAFCSCNNLRDIMFNDKLETIGNSAFKCCVSLKEINLPKSINVIKNSAFENCSSLENINIPSGIRAIEESTFSGCDSLKEIVIPNTVKKLEPYSLNCRNLEKIVIPVNTYSIEDAFFAENKKINIFGLNGSFAQKYAYDNMISFTVDKNMENEYSDTSKNKIGYMTKDDFNPYGRIYNCIKICIAQHKLNLQKRKKEDIVILKEVMSLCNNILEIVDYEQYNKSVIKNSVANDIEVLGLFAYTLKPAILNTAAFEKHSSQIIDIIKFLFTNDLNFNDDELINAFGYIKNNYEDEIRGFIENNKIELKNQDFVAKLNFIHNGIIFIFKEKQKDNMFKNNNINTALMIELLNNGVLEFNSCDDIHFNKNKMWAYPESMIINQEYIKAVKMVFNYIIKQKCLSVNYDDINPKLRKYFKEASPLDWINIFKEKIISFSISGDIFKISIDKNIKTLMPNINIYIAMFIKAMLEYNQIEANFNKMKFNYIIDEITENDIDIQKDIVEDADIQEDIIEDTDMQEDIIEDADMQEDIIEDTDMQEDIVEDTDMQEDIIEDTDMQEDIVKENINVKKDIDNSANKKIFVFGNGKIVECNDFELEIPENYSFVKNVSGEELIVFENECNGDMSKTKLCIMIGRNKYQSPLTKEVFYTGMRNASKSMQSEFEELEVNGVPACIAYTKGFTGGIVNYITVFLVSEHIQLRIIFNNDYDNADEVTKRIANSFIVHKNNSEDNDIKSIYLAFDEELSEIISDVRGIEDIAEFINLSIHKMSETIEALKKIDKFSSNTETMIYSKIIECYNALKVKFSNQLQEKIEENTKKLAVQIHSEYNEAVNTVGYVQNDVNEYVEILDEILKGIDKIYGMIEDIAKMEKSCIDLIAFAKIIIDCMNKTVTLNMDYGTKTIRQTKGKSTKMLKMNWEIKYSNLPSIALKKANELKKREEEEKKIAELENIEKNKKKKREILKEINIIDNEYENIKKNILKKKKANELLIRKNELETLLNSDLYKDI